MVHNLQSRCFRTDVGNSHPGIEMTYVDRSAVSDRQNSFVESEKAEQCQYDLKGDPCAFEHGYFPV